MEYALLKFVLPKEDSLWVKIDRGFVGSFVLFKNGP